MKNIIQSLAFLLGLFLIAQFIFGPTHLFYEIWWLDIPMHFLGGAGVAMLAISILKYKNKEVSFKNIFFFFITIAILWELYEYGMYYFFDFDKNGWSDTIQDIIIGFLGTSTVYIFNKKN